jgi:two-component system, sensor histidine kinase and response regulator
MQSGSDQSIRRKVTRIALLTCGVTALVACAAFAVYDFVSYHRLSAAELTTAAEVAGSNISGALASNDFQAASAILNSLNTQPYIVEACVYKTDGSVFAKYSRNGSGSFVPPASRADEMKAMGRNTILFREIRSNGWPVGTIYLKSDRADLYASAMRFVEVVLLVSWIFLAMAYWLATRLQRVISEPILQLVQAASAVSARKDYSLRAVKKSDDEIGSLVDHFNEMMGQIQAREIHLQGARAELEGRVYERTKELQKEIIERKLAERELEKRTSFLNSLIENNPLAIVATNNEHVLEICNPAFEKLFGYCRQEIRGRSLIDMLSSDELRTEMECTKEKVEEGSAVHSVTQRKRADGSLVDVEMFAVPIATNGKQSGHLSMYQDITQRKQAEQELEERKFFLNSLIENCPIGIVAIDTMGIAQMCNPGFETIFGYRQQEIQGRPLSEFLTTPELRAEVDSNRVRLEHGKRTHLVTRRKRSDGTLVDVEAFSVPLLSDGKHTGAVVLYQDITERKLAEAALLNSKETAEAASRIKSEFLANMSHEIRTPMNGIIGMTELVLDTELDPEQREYLNLAKISADSLLSLINDILDYSKIEAGKLDIEAIDFKLGDCLSDTMKSLSLRAHQKGLELAFEIDPSVPDALLGDPGRLRQIIVNLVGNAIKFTEHGEVVLSVHLESRADENLELHFVVADTGIGISPDKQDGIFEAFKQADGSMTRKYGGTGLGLTISSRLVELMGGRIWVESDTGKGSKFNFTVRFQVQKELVRTHVPRDPATLSNMRVLIVDDNATNRQILVKILESWNMQVATAESGSQAMVALVEARGVGRSFPLILVDAQMPEMDGFTLAEYIKRHSDFRTATVMMLSSAGHRGDATRCRELGISAYLTKPVRQEELLDAILTALGTRPAAEIPPAPVARHPMREVRNRLGILLAEDNTVNQLVAVRLLEKHGHTVTVAENGRKALQAFDQNSFDMILMDVQMPEMDGWEATQAIRLKEKTSGGHIPIVAMTAHAMKGDEERCIAAGMDDYLTKPIRTVALLAALDKVLSRLPESVAAARVSASGASTDAVDVAVALERLDGDRDLYGELVQVFRVECPNVIEEMRHAIAQQDAKALERSAHGLKGSSAQLGGLAVSQIAMEIEKLARSGNVESSRDYFKILQNEIERMFAGLESICQP